MSPAKIMMFSFSMLMLLKLIDLCLSPLFFHLDLSQQNFINFIGHFKEPTFDLFLSIYSSFSISLIFTLFPLPSIFLGHYSAILFLTSPSIPEKMFYAHYILLIFVLSIILSLSASFWVISSGLPSSSLILSIFTSIEFAINPICWVFFLCYLVFNISILGFLFDSFLKFTMVLF